MAKKTSAALERFICERAYRFVFSNGLIQTMGWCFLRVLAMLWRYQTSVSQKSAYRFFAGRSCNRNKTVREDLPEGFQRSEFLLDHGAIDMIVDRREMRQRVASLVAKMTNQPSPLVVSVNDSPNEATYEVPEAPEKG